MLETLTQFGAAGLMGALWIWERRLSRRRESQLDQAHRSLCTQRTELRMLVRLVRRNTQAIERFDHTQQRLNHVLEKMHDESTHKAA